MEILITCTSRRHSRGVRLRGVADLDHVLHHGGGQSLVAGVARGLC